MLKQKPLENEDFFKLHVIPYNIIINCNNNISSIFLKLYMYVGTRNKFNMDVLSKLRSYGNKHYSITFV